MASVEDKKEDFWKKWSLLASVIMFLLVQSGSALWWASNITSKLDGITEKLEARITNITEKVEYTINDKYGKSQATADFAIRDQKIDNLDLRLKTFEKQLDSSLCDIRDGVRQLGNKLDAFIINYYQNEKSTKK